MYGYPEAISQKIDFPQGLSLDEYAEYFMVQVCYVLLRIWNGKYHEKSPSLLIIKRKLALSFKQRLIVNNISDVSITNGTITIDIKRNNKQNMLSFHFNTSFNISCELELNLQHTLDFIEGLLSISQQLETDARNWALENYKTIMIKEIEKITESSYVHD